MNANMWLPWSRKFPCPGTPLDVSPTIGHPLLLVASIDIIANSQTGLSPLAKEGRITCHYLKSRFQICDSIDPGIWRGEPCSYKANQDVGDHQHYESLVCVRYVRPQTFDVQERVGLINRKFLSAVSGNQRNQYIQPVSLHVPEAVPLDRGGGSKTLGSRSRYVEKDVITVQVDCRSSHPTTVH